MSSLGWTGLLIASEYLFDDIFINSHHIQGGLSDPILVNKINAQLRWMFGYFKKLYHAFGIIWARCISNGVQLNIFKHFSCYK